MRNLTVLTLFLASLLSLHAALDARADQKIDIAPLLSAPSPHGVDRPDAGEGEESEEELHAQADRHRAESGSGEHTLRLVAGR